MCRCAGTQEERHVVSLYDMCYSSLLQFDLEQWDEKITDCINYLILLKALIKDAMQRVMENRTSIVIAHRLSTIRDSDLIVVMDHGEIVENGSHKELFERKGRYYELYMTQYAGFAI